MKRIFILLTLALAMILPASAESTITLFMQSVSNTDIKISANGKELVDMNGPIKNKSKAGGYRITTFKDCYRKINVEGQGKLTLGVVMNFTNPMNGVSMDYDGSIDLDIKDGENYYLQIDQDRGTYDMEFNTVKPKDVEKRLKKWEELPAVTLKL